MAGEKKKNRKELIEETALRLFSSAGYHATSVDSIVQAAGVSKGLFYFHYESKGDLLQSMMYRTLAGLWSGVYQEKDASITPIKSLERFLDSYFLNIKKNEQESRLYISMMLLNPGLFDSSVVRHMESYRNLIGFMEWVFGRMGCPEPKQERIYFSNLIFGVEMRYFTKKSSRERELSEMKKMILEKYRLLQPSH